MENFEIEKLISELFPLSKEDSENDNIESYINCLPQLAYKIARVNNLKGDLKTNHKNIKIFKTKDRFTDEIIIETDFININRIQEFVNYKNNLNSLVSDSIVQFKKLQVDKKDSVYLKLKSIILNGKIDKISFLFYTLKIKTYENFYGWSNKLFILHSNNKTIAEATKTDTLFVKYKFNKKNFEAYDLTMIELNIPQYEQKQIDISVDYIEYRINVNDYLKILESNTVEFSLRSEDQDINNVNFKINEDKSKLFSSFQSEINNNLETNNQNSNQKINQTTTKTTKEVDTSHSQFINAINLLSKRIENQVKADELIKIANNWLKNNPKAEDWLKFKIKKDTLSPNSSTPTVAKKINTSFNDTLQKLIEAEQFSDAKNYLKEKTGKSPLDIKITLAEYAEKFGKSDKYKKYEKRMNIMGYGIVIGIVLFLIWIFT